MESNKITLLRNKFQALKASIKAWCKEDKQRTNASRFSVHSRISELDKMLDKGKSYDDLVTERTLLLKDLHNINVRHSLDMTQKPKLRDWIDEPSKVKNEFLNHFSNRFSMPSGPNIKLDTYMFMQNSFDQNEDLESEVTYEEIKRAIINQDVVNVVREFFITSKSPPGSNSSFITLIFKMQDPKVSISIFIRVNSYVLVSLMRKLTWLPISCDVVLFPCLSTTLASRLECLAQEVWRFISQGSSLWSRLIKALYDDRVSLDGTGSVSHPSLWNSIIRELGTLSLKALRQIYPRMYALESDKHASVADKLSDVSLIDSFRRALVAVWKNSNTSALLILLPLSSFLTPMIDGCGHLIH
nr:hypothetical protein [Tanacetum cinerariifolium]